VSPADPFPHANAPRPFGEMSINIPGGSSMNDHSSSANKLQWKWVVITFVLYLVFYLLPIVAVAYLTRNTASSIGNLFIGTWMFGGLIIVAGVAAYISTGITIFEPAIASGSMVILWVIIFSLFVPYARFDVTRDALTALGIICVVFILSLVGAWLGERAQKIWKTPTQDT
jgi:hypothetical protein